MTRVRTAIILFVFAYPRADAAAVDFVRDVRPILRKHCHSCHGESKQKGSLRLDIKSEAFKGGESYGSSVIAAKPQDSPLIQLVISEDEDSRMPLDGERLSEAEIATLTKWVAEGAVWPDGIDLEKLEDKRDHWSFKPIARPAIPEVRDRAWPRSEVDRFVLARLEREGLSPAPEADPVTWLRRVSLDLTGLPPTTEEATAFLAALQKSNRPDATNETQSPCESAVDRLLASPRYGERWAQHWLDVVRYADTHGFEVNTERPNAWPYRDYVIRAFNSETPYDQFIREQIVGDALGQDAATGFLITASVLLPGQIGADEPSKRLARQDSLDEIVVNIGQTFLGLSVGCARCHDHKFDPISQRDYFAMQAFVAGVEYADREVRTPEAPTKPYAAEGRKAEEQKGEEQKGEGAKGEGAKVEGQKIEGQKAFAGTFRKPDVIRLLLRGDPEQPQAEVAPAVLSALGSLALPSDADEQQRRMALANWIANPQNALAARVMVNRLWQGHFGTGLVETASDFGRTGAKPTHPELLDWLAEEFIRSGWSIKRIHRLIVLSATYRQATQYHERAAAHDADVRLLWRFPSRRLDAETIRDAMLAASGQLNLKMGGRGFDLFDQRGGLSGFKPVESYSGDGLRRMIYAHKVRREREAVFGAFDCPDAGQSTARRRESTTPIQALNLFNSRFTIEQSDAFATRVKVKAGDDVTRQIHRAYQVALNRDPQADEITDAEPIVRAHGLATLCRVLFNSNEFLFLP